MVALWGIWMLKFATVLKLKQANINLHAWALDSPTNDMMVKITERGLYIQGWLLMKSDTLPATMVVRTVRGTVEEQRVLTFNSGRPDVIQRVLGVAPSEHRQLRCGYSGYLPDVPEEFTLGVMLDGEVTWLCVVRLEEREDAILENGTTTHESTPPVIQGTDGWLFLDNDTNHSVDQHTGRLILDKVGLARWAAYFDDCRSLASSVDARHAILIAASKEQVLPEHYPHRKGELTVTDQVLAISNPSDHVVNTASFLAKQPEKTDCFIKTDTHWTDRGAMLATLALIDALLLDAAQVRQHFANDVYYTMPFAGDLGVKLTPVRATSTEFLNAPTPATDAIFDNHLPNIGRVLIFETSNVLWKNSLLIFGASSSYPMLKYLKRLFKRIVFIHSAGNVDPEIILHERPDFLVMQTTARFMIEPPHTNFSIHNAVITKIGSASEDVRSRAKELMSKETQQEENLPYYRMLGALI